EHEPVELEPDEPAAVADRVEERRQEHAQRQDGEEGRAGPGADVLVDRGEALRADEPFGEGTPERACQAEAGARPQEQPDPAGAEVAMPGAYTMAGRSRATCHAAAIVNQAATAPNSSRAKRAPRKFPARRTLPEFTR